MQFAINTLISALLIAAAAELSRRSNFWAALLISLPVSSIIALSIVYVQTHDLQKVTQLSYGIFWLVLPSLLLFLILPLLLRTGINFWFSMSLSCLALAISYLGYSFVLKKFGANI